MWEYDLTLHITVFLFVPEYVFMTSCIRTIANYIDHLNLTFC